MVLNFLIVEGLLFFPPIITFKWLYVMRAKIIDPGARKSEEDSGVPLIYSMM